MWLDASAARDREARGQVLRSGCSVASAQTKPASSRAQATTIFCCGLPRPAIRCQRAWRRCWQRQARSTTAGSWPALAAGELVADGWPPAGVPGRFDQQPAHVAVADFRDRALSALLAGGALRGHEPDEGHQLRGRPEAVEVADLSDEGERGQRVDPTQATQPRDQRGVTAPARPCRGSRAPAGRSARRRGRPRAGRCRRSAAERRTRSAAR